MTDKVLQMQHPLTSNESLLLKNLSILETIDRRFLGLSRIYTGCLQVIEEECQILCHLS